LQYYIVNLFIYYLVNCKRNKILQAHGNDTSVYNGLCVIQYSS